MAAGAQGARISYGKGRFLTGQFDTVWMPPRVTRRFPILYLPSGPDVANVGIARTLNPGQHALFTALSRGGAVVVVCDWDIGAAGHYGSSFGAPLIATHIETVRNTIASLAASLGVSGVSLLDTSQVVLSGGSQGACDCYRAAHTNPTRVKAIGTWASGIDLPGYYTGTYRWPSDAGTANRTTIAACYGITYPTPLPSDADPYANASSVTCPWLLAYSDGDATTPTSSALAMAAALPDGKAIRVSTADPHADVQAGSAAMGGLAAWLLDQAS